jgi:hypothetical protein
MTHTNSSAYLPGVHNINRREAMYRRRVGYAALLVFVTLLVIFVAFSRLLWWRTLLVLPAFVSALGFLQARYHFCVMYASKGKQNAAENSTQPNTITSEAALEKDRHKVMVMYLQAAMWAIAAVLLSLLLPSFGD